MENKEKEKPLNLILPPETIDAYRNIWAQIERINNMTAETVDALRTSFEPVFNKVAEINRSTQDTLVTLAEIIQIHRESLASIVIEPMREVALKWQETIEQIESVNPDFFKRPVPESLISQIDDVSSYIEKEIIVGDGGNGDDDRPIIHYHIHVEQTKTWNEILVHLLTLIQIVLTLYASSQADQQFDTLMFKLDEIRTSIEQQINEDR